MRLTANREILIPMRRFTIFLWLFLSPLVLLAQQVTQAEYYVDTDPGAGLATPMVAADGSFSDALETALMTNAGGWTLGFHKIGVRVKDNNGYWGPAFITVLHVQSPAVLPAINISTGECFWDTDPGQGNGTPMLAFDGNFNNAMETVVKSNFAHPGLGMHVLNVRVRDVNNNWGPVFRTVVSVQNLFVLPSINIAAGECFWDTDPGQGSGTPMLAFDGNFNNAMESVVKSNFAHPGLGMHVLHVRVKDVNNNWGPVFRTVVDVQNPFTYPSIRIAAGECFWDNDPGQGNGIPMLAFDGNFSDAMDALALANFANPGLGMHKLGVRTRDVNNNWGAVFSTVVSVQDPFVYPSIQVTSAELFWDSDPGQGNGTSMLAFDGNYNDAYERATANEQAMFLQQGLHVLNVRAIGANGQWSPLFRSVVYLDSCTTNPSVTITAGGPTTFCPGDSVQLTATSGYTTYYWRRNGVLFGGNTQSVWVTQAGNYVVTIIDASSCPGTSAIVSVTVSQPTATISGGPLTFCQGDSVTLDAGAGFASYAWSNGATSQTITVSAAGTYTVAVTNTFGCSDTSAAVTTNVLPAPATPVITQSMDTLFSSSATGNQWYLNGNPIPGATGASYIAGQSGNYTVVVTGGNGCTATSQQYAFVATSVMTEHGTVYALVYPNPIGENGTLLIHAEGFEGDATITIFDMVGRAVILQQLQVSNSEARLPLDRAAFAAGTYLYVVRLNDGTALNGKFVVD